MMQHSGVTKILSENDARGERLIAIFQVSMALVICSLHLISASKNQWETLSGITMAMIFGILIASLVRVSFANKQVLPTQLLHGLTFIDGMLLFGLILSYNIAYALPLAAAFKSPSVVLFLVFTCVRVVKFDPITILVAGFTVLFGWSIIHGLALVEGIGITSSYTQYLTSNSIMIGASFEYAMGYTCAMLALAYAMQLARGFVARTALIEDLESANQTAQQNAAKFEDLFMSSVEGIMLVDQNGNIERANTSMAKIFGFVCDELIGNNVALLMSEDNANLLRKSISDYLEGGKNSIVGHRFETRGKHKNGEIFPIELSINEFAAPGQIRFAAFVQDISLRKQSEQNEKQAKAQFENAVNAAMDAIIIIDEKGLIVGFNPAAEETFGFKLQDVVGKKLSETIIPERYRDAHENGIKHYLHTGEAPVLNSRIEIEGLHSNGEELMIELAIKEINSNSGKLFFGYARDIGERKAAEQQMIDAKNEAEIASQSKARFLAMMSHEIRTPLNGVLGIVNLLDETELNSEQRNLLDTARQSGQSLLAIINDILDFSKLEAGKFTVENSPFELDKLVESVVSLIKPQATEKGLALNYKLQPSAKQILIGDADRIRQVLINLVWNAVKFTDSGNIDISVICETNGKVSFEVKDTGIGIAEEKIKNLFCEFSTLDEHRKAKTSGTGLGLVICKALVETMDGEIFVNSTRGEGSSFWFDLPLEVSRDLIMDSQESDAVSLNEGQFSGAKILVAEDNATNQFIIRNYLARMGCIVDIANDGLDAVSMFKTSQYDLILMDISMPKMDGFEATHEIRNSNHTHNDIPIVAFTAYASREDQEEVLAKGLNDYITKPFSKEQLLGTILKHLSRKDIAPVATNGSNIGLPKDDFDSRILASVFEGQDADKTRKLLGLFEKDLIRYEAAIASGLKDNDWKMVEKATHGLKGTTGMFGAEHLCGLAEEVNQLCRLGNIENQLELAIHLITETKKIIKQVSPSEDGNLPEFLVNATGSNDR